MNIEGDIIASIEKAIAALYNTSDSQQVKIEKTKTDFVGDYTYVVFPIVRISRKSPEQTAEEIGQYLKANASFIQDFNVIKGFLNLVIDSNIWLNYLQTNWNNTSFTRPSKNEKVMVEYSSPNTNKPLHLGHIRNNLLGYSLSQIFQHTGYDLIKANLINDRGIHICKSMLAWELYGNGETPLSFGLKGDHLVGKYYVIFENKLREQTAVNIENAIAGNFEFADSNIQKRYSETLQKLQVATEEKQIAKLSDDIKEFVRNNSNLMIACQDMLRKWEAGDAETIQLWKKMNDWVYEGFNMTYTKLGVSFDKYYYESNTYKLGKDLVQEGLAKGVFYQKPDNSVWIDLTADGLDEKLVQRGDGTSVYITQDIGTAELKFQEFGMNRSIYVVGNEQDYHFKVLFLIMQKLGKSYAQGMYHLSYGMVDLPSGKMKSREGTVVDADDLLTEMFNTAKEKTIELGKTDGLSDEELNNLYTQLSLSALKFFILKVDPRKRMLFNPQESIDFQGDTGPFIQYTYARIRSILRQAGNNWQTGTTATALHPAEINTIKVLYDFPAVLEDACKDYSPAIICQYCLDLARAYNRLYNEVSILRETDETLKNLRLKLAHHTAETLKFGLNLLGINVVERM
jgi:arginyl-tRNA synthetase